MPHHQTLEIRDFTCFHEASFEFSPGINVFVGENGTGKTHALKLLYAVQRRQFNQVGTGEFPTDVFNAKLSSLVRNDAGIFRLLGEFGSNGWCIVLVDLESPDRRSEFLSLAEEQPQLIELSEAELQQLRVAEAKHTFSRFEGDEWPDVGRPVFIPTQDILGHYRRFVSLYDTYKIDFDSTYRDLATILGAPEKRELNPYQEEMLALIRGLVGGEFAYKGEGFVLDYGQGEHEAALVAEGHRKLGALALLIRNGMLEPGGTLFWDEPEANVNPTAMDELVTVLLTLARHGVQIFLSTHSYVVLKELDLQGTAADAVRYFAFGKSDDGTRVSSSMDFTTLSPNPILDQYDSLFSRDVQKSLGEPVL